MQSGIKDLITRRRNRAIAIILTAKEDLCDSHISDESSLALRKIVLDQVNELCDLFVDLMDTVDDSSIVMNEIYLSKIDEIHRALTGSDE